MINIIDRISHAGGKKNEDLLRKRGNTLLLLDGSTGLTKNAPDACAFTKSFADLFFKYAARGAALNEAVNAALSDLEKIYLQTYGPDAFDVPPSASIAAIQARENMLELINVGDCTTHIFSKEHRRIYSIYDDTVSKFDNAVIDRIKQIKEASILDVRDIVDYPEIRQMLLSNRKKMNKPDGYEILAFGMRKLTDKDVQRFPIEAVTSVLMFTDGFELCSRELSSLPVPSLKEVYKKLRRLEHVDTTLNDHPRFKISDDASAVLFDIK